MQMYVLEHTVAHKKIRGEINRNTFCMKMYDLEHTNAYKKSFLNIML